MFDADYNAALDGESGEQSEVPKKPDIERDSHISDTRHDNNPIKEIKEPIVKDRPGLSQPLGLGIDWDAGYQTRFVKWVMAEKRARQYERGRLDIYWKRLGEERKRFEEQKKDLRKQI